MTVRACVGFDGLGILQTLCMGGALRMQTWNSLRQPSGMSQSSCTLLVSTENEQVVLTES